MGTTTLMLLTEDGRYTVSLNHDLTSTAFIDDLVRPIMLAAGYAEKNVDEALGCDCDCNLDDEE